MSRQTDYQKKMAAWHVAKARLRYEWRRAGALKFAILIGVALGIAIAVEVLR